MTSQRMMTTNNESTLATREWEAYWEGIASSDLPTRLDALRRAEAELSAQVESGAGGGKTSQN
ncbi:MAG: hypothetical protein Q4P05_04350 [Actinomycetaceae bacterium]|nr:hypothetical protein [Actinomycetaceae bacterium]